MEHPVPEPHDLTPEQLEQRIDMLRHRFAWLSSFSDEELQDLCYCEARMPIQESEAYLDLNHPERGVIIGEKGDWVPEGSCYVPRSQVSLHTWNKLIDGYQH